jgi:hypothetical protein
MENTTIKSVTDVVLNKIKNLFFNRDRWNHVAYVKSEKGHSIFLNGKDQFLKFPDNEDWNFGLGDFTIEFWTRFQIFTPKTWSKAQQFAFSKHFYKV